ncbi:glycosyltransferase family 1 protein [Clostridium cochlearium]|uniref:glycosyltransferase family 1 protein n=1 Tax=Clostridium cochlearium TaxID=1494 RepID=UPI001570B484|nr:glycosyltransferase family 1 protein [Clostridium cochlearium]MBV1817956.1 glycosyltransferase family 1 protein [Bacteroidales bacterium MSK.15.36]MCG4571353.1 glycosyltransferase family 1 protein [Clostridium cochlearium]MCG4580006.1 glycosyltransferase family 1 protein [Clostridium cochlearium]NSJ90594.1 glycosyltransferase family 1 protein [Coprococcus sp. MSK.21.13]
MQKPIRILHVLGALNRGGAETMIMNIYRNIERSKIQFDFMIHTDKECDYNDEIIKLGGKIYNVPRYSGSNHFNYKKAWDSFFNIHPEYRIIHGHMRSTASIYLKIAKKHRLITIAHSHSTSSRGNKFEQLVKNIMQFPIRYIADYLFACSDEAGKWLFGRNVLNKSNYKVIKNAIDIEKYTFNEVKRNEIREILGIEDKFVVGHVGSFTYPKNHKFLISVFYEIQKKYKDSILLLVGDGEIRPYIQKHIDDLGINDKVKLTGVVGNVNDYMQAMDVFVFPSIFEGLGIVAIEAQTSGLPCIVAETIPKEAYVTDLIKSVSLKEPVDIWAETILKYIAVYERRNTYKQIKCSGYDIFETAKWFEEFYLNSLFK